MADDPTTRRTRKRRWDSSANPQEEGAGGEEAKNKGPDNSDNNGASSNNAADVSSTSAADPRARAAALQASIQARLAALKARTTSSATQGSKKRPLVIDAAAENAQKKARVYELDMSITAPTRLLERDEKQQRPAKAAAPKINPYLAHIHTAVDNRDSDAHKHKSTNDNRNDDNDVATNTDIQKQLYHSSTKIEIIDHRLSTSTTKRRQHHRPIHFITPGTYIALGEKKREMASRAEKSGYISGRKVGNVFKSVGMGGSNAIGHEDHDGAKQQQQQGSYYGASEAGKLMRDRLPARLDAPELDIEDFINKNKKSTTAAAATVTSDDEKKDVPVMEALRAAESTMPYAMEWWDAELLPSKLRKELALEEGKVIASRARKQGGGGGFNKAATTEADTAAAPASSSSADNTTATPMQQYSSQKQQHDQLIQKCYNAASLSHSKTHSLVQHPIPILTPAQKAAQEALRNKPPTIHLTKAERKRHRKLRRAERQREQQDLQAAGLIPPPEPRLTLSNYMKVLGDQAVLDPSKIEARVMEQIQARKLKHEQMNADRKLTKEQRSEKHARKLHEDTSVSVCVALFWVRDMSHPYHRAKVDLNAQQNGITGGVLECESSSSDGGGDGDENVVLVVAEGGEKAIKRYIRLMTVRMRWKGEDFYEEEEEEEDDEIIETMEEDGNDGDEEPTTKVQRKKFNPNNECELIWTGMAVKRAFHSFMFQTAPNSNTARKILEAKGVPHYWDLAVGHYEKRKVGSSVGGNNKDGDMDGALRFRLG